MAGRVQGHRGRAEDEQFYSQPDERQRHRGARRREQSPEDRREKSGVPRPNVALVTVPLPAYPPQ